MNITIQTVTNAGIESEVRTILEQNGQRVIIGFSMVRPGESDIRLATARVLKSAAEWLESRIVDLRATGGAFAARS